MVQADFWADLAQPFEEAASTFDKAFISGENQTFDWRVENKTNQHVYARVVTFNTDYSRHLLNHWDNPLEPQVGVAKANERGDVILHHVNRWCIEVYYMDASMNPHKYYNQNKECNVEYRDRNMGRYVSVEIHGGPDAANTPSEIAAKSPLNAKITFAEDRGNCDVDLKPGDDKVNYCPN